MTIGILAVQGAFAEHEKMLSKLSCECFDIIGNNFLSLRI